MTVGHGQPEKKSIPWVFPVRLGAALRLLLVALLHCDPARAVVLFSTADPTYNTSAAGTVAETAWSYQGNWGAFMGTAISPHYFITAKHVDSDPVSRVGAAFTFGGVSYSTAAYHDAPAGVDLRIWEVSGSLPAHAPLYTGTDELGQDLVVIGRGTQRGVEVTVSGVTKGWRDGTGDHVVRWGENTVSDLPTINGADYLAATFDATGGANEAHLTVGDSGGGVFILDPADSLWKLAGINWAVDGLWSHDGTTGSGFRAAISDAGGLYVGSDTDGYTLIPDETVDLPSSFYATRMSSYDDWIQTVIPEPKHYALTIGLGLLALMGYRRSRVRRVDRRTGGSRS